MNELKFTDLELNPEIQRAIDEIGFEHPTDIQAAAIPLLRTGVDVIGRSQTGTGKTLAFAIPAVEKIEHEASNPTPQVLILCPTRELAQQGCKEIQKITRFMRDIWPVEVYGGAAMDRQIMRLRRANLVIGTPGRIMDHMRRGTITLSNIKMVVLDEADEMLSMGFRDDIETILKEVPEERQTVLFSATMPDAILELTRRYQHAPQMIQINQAQVTLDQIQQRYMEVPMGRKLDALVLLLHAYGPQRCMIFTNTKLMADEVSAHLNRNNFTCEAIHGDMNQSQRTRVMEGFKSARLPILVATDVAARGIDVNDIDYVINYDLPQNNEYYVHRIGRTGRAGKEGCAISLLSGRKQFFQIRDIARSVKSEIKEIAVPTVEEIRRKMDEKNLERIQEAILSGVSERHQEMVNQLLERGHDLSAIAAAAFDIGFARDDSSLQDIVVERKTVATGGVYRKMVINIGRRQRIAPNHIVSAVADCAHITGSQIGKIEIFDDKTFVGIPAAQAEEIVHAMDGLKICGIPTMTRLTADQPTTSPRPQGRSNFGGYGAKKAPKPPIRQYGRPAQSKPAMEAPQRRSAVKLSPEAKARLLNANDLSRFEFSQKGDSAERRANAAGYNGNHREHGSGNPFESKNRLERRSAPRKHPY